MPLRPLLLLCLAGTAFPSAPAFDGVFRPFGDGSTGAFLAPPAPGNHASSLEQLGDGTVAVAWFSGGEGQPGCAIALALLPPTPGAAFSPGRLVSQRANYSNQNPVLFWEAAPQLLHLYHTSQATGPGGGENTSVILHLQSADGGRTWTAPALFYAALGAFTRGPMVQRMGGLMLPCYMSLAGTDYSFMLLQGAPGGAAWAPTALNQSGDLIQPAVVRPLRQPGLLRAFFRDEDAVAIYVADSVDEGATWALPARTALPSNNAGIAARTLASGALAMVLNPHAGTVLPRSPLAVALSSDEGATWPCSRVLQTHDVDSGLVGEYSYPALIQEAASGDLLVSYTYDRETILVRRFTEAWVREGCAG